MATYNFKLVVATWNKEFHSWEIHAHSFAPTGIICMLQFCIYNSTCLKTIQCTQLGQLWGSHTYLCTCRNHNYNCLSMKTIPKAIFVCKSYCTLFNICVSHQNHQRLRLYTRQSVGHSDYVVATAHVLFLLKHSFIQFIGCNTCLAMSRAHINFV